MQLQLDVSMVDLLTNKDYKDNNKNITLKKVILQSLLLAQKTTDPLLSFDLAQKINNEINSTLSLSSEEVIFIKNTIRESSWMVGIKGQALRIIEDFDTDKKGEK